MYIFGIKIVNLIFCLFLSVSYVCWSGELELAGSGETETPVQKYQRLNCEVRELLEELDAAKEGASAKAQDGGSGAADGLTSVALKVSSLQEELTRLKLEEVLGSQVLKDLQDPQVSSPTYEMLAP